MITRRAFSRTANLGQLYDAHNDMLLPSNILNLNEKDTIQTAIKSNKNEYVEHDFVYAYTNDDQFRHLDIDANLRLNLYAGLIDIGGSGKYLTSTKTNENSIKGSFYYKLVKEDDELLIENLWADAINNDDITKLFNIPVLFAEMSKNATHVIIKRQFGADLFFTFESKRGDKELLRKIETRVEVAIVEANAGIGTTKETSSTNNYEDIHVSFYGDCKPPTKYKGTVESVLDSLQDISEMTQEPKQMKWFLYPIQHLIKLQEIIKNKLQSSTNLSENNWIKLGYIISPSKYLLTDEDNDKYKLLFFNWDILLYNLKKLDLIEKKFHIDDLIPYRNIISDIKVKQMQFNLNYKNNIIKNIISFKEKQSKIDINKLIESINTLNKQIEDYLHSQYNLNINKNGCPNVINISRISNLNGLNFIRFINNPYINKYDYDDMNLFIKKTKNTVLNKNYYFYCNKFIKSSFKNENKKIRYIRLCQHNNDIPIDQRWLNINNIEVYDEDNNIISLNTKYIKIKYSSKSQEWSTGNVISNDRNTYFHSNNGEYEWIYIDLGIEMNISKVIIYNRQDNDYTHDNQIRIAGCILELYRDYSELNNKFLVYKFLITSRAYKYIFNLNDLDKKQYLMCLRKKYNKNTKFDFNKDIQVYYPNETVIEEEYKNNQWSSYYKTYDYNIRPSEIKNISDSNIYNNPSFPKPSYGFIWDRGVYDNNIIKINQLDMSKHIVKYEDAEKYKLVTDIPKDKFYDTYICDIDNWEIIYLPYWIQLDINNNEIDYTFYKFWNKTLLQPNTNLIMWFPDKIMKNISAVDDKYLIDLFMPCPHNSCNDNTLYKNWVCYQCFSIAKIRKINNKWCLNCKECNQVIPIKDCYFNCNDIYSHGPEPYPFNDDFDCDNLKFHYLNSTYSFNNPLEYNRILIYDDSVVFEDRIMSRKCVNTPNTNNVKSYESLGKFHSFEDIIKPCRYSTFSPFTILIPNHCLETEYITIDIKNDCGHYFFIRRNYIYYRTLNCGEFNNTITRLMNDFNTQESYNDQFKHNTIWLTDYKNLQIEFSDTDNVCHIDGKQYFYNNINPHACTVEFKKNKRLSKYLKRNYFKWFFLINTHLDKLFCIEFKNNKPNNWFSASLKI